jgi:UDP-N-acetylglucosamine/UDP-N-acetylgalactosamine diphosphorylase
MTDIEALRRTLDAHGQSHLLGFYDELSESHQQLLRGQLEAVDFDAVGRWADAYVRNKPTVKIPENIEPPEIIPYGGGGQAAQARARGEQLLAAGKVAVFTVAGGQGTRLGYEGPKGCLPATPVVNKPLFRLFAETIRAAAIRHDATIPWYILTSPTNDTATQAHFRQNDFWGLSSKDVVFVTQGTMPAIDFNGRLMLARPYRLAVSPDGHGGSLTALRRSGALDDMARRGVELISYFQVDNPLVRVVDPVFLGLHDLAGAEMSAKALPKRSPTEPIGNFCTAGGKTIVIEYSDMPEDPSPSTSSAAPSSNVSPTAAPAAWASTGLRKKCPTWTLRGNSFSRNPPTPSSSKCSSSTPCPWPKKPSSTKRSVRRSSARSRTRRAPTACRPASTTRCAVGRTGWSGPA